MIHHTDPLAHYSNKSKGFVLQFIGYAHEGLESVLVSFADMGNSLRGMHFSASLASLVVAAVMTILRTVLRRGLALIPNNSPTPSQSSYTVWKLRDGHELDYIAKHIMACTHWSVVTHVDPSLRPHEGSHRGINVWRAQMRLAELSGSQWEAELQSTVNNLTETIQAIADHLWNPLGGVTISRETRQLKTLDWHVLVNVGSDLEQGVVKIGMSLEKEDMDGRGPWLAKRAEISAILCLWMSSFEQEHTAHTEKRNNLWLLGSAGDHGDIGRALSDWWISRESTRVEVLSDDSELGSTCAGFNVAKNPVLDCVFPTGAETPGIRADFPDTAIRTRPAFTTPKSLTQMCAQYLVSVFVSFAAHWIERIESSTEIKIVDDQRVLAIRNDDVSELAEIVQRFGLATREDAHRIIVPALSRAHKLPSLAIRILTLADDGGWEWPFKGRPQDATSEARAKEFYRLIQSICIDEINTLIGQKRWTAAGNIMQKLETTYSTVIGPQNHRTIAVRTTRHELCTKLMSTGNPPSSPVQSGPGPVLRKLPPYL